MILFLSLFVRFPQIFFMQAIITASIRGADIATAYSQKCIYKWY